MILPVSMYCSSVTQLGGWKREKNMIQKIEQRHLNIITRKCSDLPTVYQQEKKKVYSKEKGLLPCIRLPT